MRVAHVEAGLRSGDRSMPEEINRRITDAIATLLLTPSADGDANLRSEGVADSRIRLVGNVMIDTLVKMLPLAERSDILPKLKLDHGKYVLATLHRPSNVDDPVTLGELMTAINRLSEQMPIAFPVHPRTRQRISDIGTSIPQGRVRMIDPVGYVDCLALLRGSRFVLTDSGGVQEETTYLQIPCLTARPNTERPVTLTHGSNRLVESTAISIEAAARDVLRDASPPFRRPPLWDGNAANRIIAALQECTCMLPDAWN
jgi:UDP-N-acetylglucosamine 2-epimerase (non-hydrolysing)